MNTLPSVRLLLLAVVLCEFLATNASFSQHPDIRLPLDPTNYALPFDARIQSAARIGARTLAVFGTTALAPGDSVVNQLRMQVLEGTRLVGPQQSLHSSAARPYGVVSVLGLKRAFLVLWNDRREASPGIYMRRVDTNGAFLGEESRYSTGVLRSSGEVRLIESIDSYDLVWSETRSDVVETFARQLTGDGQFSGGEMDLGPGDIRQSMQFDSLPGITFIDRSSGFPNIIFRDSVLAVRTMPIGLSSPFYIGGDSSIAVLLSSTLRYYRSMFDSTIYRDVVVPAMPGRSLAVLTRDTSTGWYSIVYPDVNQVNEGGFISLRMIINKLSWTADTATIRTPLDTADA
jgi:hypothetical protein